jgi:hypothetical protein
MLWFSNLLILRVPGEGYFILMQKMKFWKLFIVVSTSRSFPHSWLISWFVTRVTRRVSLVEQEILTLPEHLRSSVVWWGSCYSIFSLMRNALSIVVVGPYTFGHCVVCPSSIYGFLLPFWYLQTFLMFITYSNTDCLRGVVIIVFFLSAVDKVDQVFDQ